MYGSASAIGTELAFMFNANTNELSKSYKRIASGKKITTPGDDFVGYIKSQSLQTTINGYQTVKEDLYATRESVTIAMAVGNTIYEDLGRMKDLADTYAKADTTADQKSLLNAEFKAVATAIMDTVNNTTYNSVGVVGANTLSTVAINPDDTSETIAISFNAGDIISDLADGTWDLDGAGGAAKTSASVQSELETAVSYLVKAQGYDTKIQRQLEMSDTITDSKTMTRSMIMDIDDVAELSNRTSLEIRQQATLAMMGQANMSRQGLLSLFS